VDAAQHLAGGDLGCSEKCYQYCMMEISFEQVIVKSQSPQLKAVWRSNNSPYFINDEFKQVPK
ncbi:MAG: hypothetical protein JSV37_01695, partial [Anaerolineaceae bacterium]